MTLFAWIFFAGGIIFGAAVFYLFFLCPKGGFHDFEEVTGTRRSATLGQGHIYTKRCKKCGAEETGDTSAPPMI